MSASFLTRLKRHLETSEVDAAASVQELQDSFRRKISSWLEKYIEVMSASLREIDRTIKASTKQVAADAFSKRREAVILDEIDHWIAADEVYRKEVIQKLARAYARKVSGQTLLKIFEEEFAKLSPKLAELVKKANNLGASWSDQLDNAGLAVKDPVIKQTIKWFSQVSVDELKRDYKRSIKEAFNI